MINLTPRYLARSSRLDVKRRFAEEQIIDFLWEADEGVAVKKFCWKHRISEARYYIWRSNQRTDARLVLCGI